MERDDSSFGAADTVPTVTVFEAGEREVKPTLSYAEYIRHGGRINETDYQSALSRVQIGNANENFKKNAKNMADFYGISLKELRSEIDPCVLYAILREDIGARELEYHHSQMGDQQILVEALRMLEQDTAAQIIISRHTSPNKPHINFS